METDCPLRESKVRKHFMRIFNVLQNRRKVEHKAEDITQMNTFLSLTDKDGKFIEVKVPEPEYWSDSIFREVNIICGLRIWNGRMLYLIT